MSGSKRVCIVGSGNWGSAIAKIVGRNVTAFPHFDEHVTMYVYEELIDGKKLTEIINETHENVKYLPRHKLPPNVLLEFDSWGVLSQVGVVPENVCISSFINWTDHITFTIDEMKDGLYLCTSYEPSWTVLYERVAVPDIVDAAKDADILIFVVPHQFIKRLCGQMAGKIKPTAVGISLIKEGEFWGFDIAEGGGIELISHIINKLLNIPVSVLMGANLAHEVAEENFCETTVGCRDKALGPVFRDLIQTDYFRVVVVDDVEAVEMCGALKNIVACGAGFVDGMNSGDNTKAAVIRLGLMEMITFGQVFYPGTKLSTFFESCGVADLITSCYGGRNRKVSEAFVRSKKTIEQLEAEMLNGQKLQGPITAAEVNHMLKAKKMEDRFPLFTAIHKICTGKIPPEELVSSIRHHPEHILLYKVLGCWREPLSAYALNRPCFVTSSKCKL